jgi:hypothetical protein
MIIKVCPGTDHEGPEGELRYCCALSLTSPLIIIIIIIIIIIKSFMLCTPHQISFG